MRQDSRYQTHVSSALLAAVVAALFIASSVTTAIADYKFKTSWKDFGPRGLMSPRAIAVDRDGFVYVSDMKNHRLAKYDSSGTRKHVWGGGQKNPSWGAFADVSDVAIGDVPDPKPGEDAQRVYVTDPDNHRVVWFERDGTYLGQWDLKSIEHIVGKVKPISIKANSVGDALYVGYQSEDDKSVFGVVRYNPFEQKPQANMPNIIALGSAFDSGGWFYATTGSAINKYHSDGTLAGNNPFKGHLYLENAIGIAFDHRDNLFVTNGADGRSISAVAQFDSGGKLVQEIAKEGRSRNKVLRPVGIAVGPDGALYVGDQGNRRVVAFSESSAS